VIVSDTDEFTVDESWLSTKPSVENRLGMSSTLESHEKALIEDALRAAGGRVFGRRGGGRATRHATFYACKSKIRTLRINKSRFRTRAAKEFVKFRLSRISPMPKSRRTGSSGPPYVQRPSDWSGNCVWNDRVDAKNSSYKWPNGCVHDQRADLRRTMSTNSSQLLDAEPGGSALVLDLTDLSWPIVTPSAS